MLFNGKSFVLVQHPKLVREPEQVTIAWLYRQMDMLNDGKWLIEGVGGLQPVNTVSKHNVSKTKLISVITKHSQLINTHPDNQFVAWVTETSMLLMLLSNIRLLLDVVVQKIIRYMVICGNVTRLLGCLKNSSRTIYCIQLMGLAMFLLTAV